MMNDETRMTKEARNPNDEVQSLAGPSGRSDPSGFVIQAFVILSSFGFRNLSFQDATVLSIHSDSAF